jgi:seryl-tRNA synthetase
MNIAFKTPGKQDSPLDAIFDALLRPMGVDGVYARTALYEQVVDALSQRISRFREPGAEVLRFPPIMSRLQVEKSGYLKSFPHLLGCVNCLQGSEADIRGAVACFEAGGDWTQSLGAAETVLSPAACYPVYPMAAERGPVPAEGLIFDVAADCFRHEPSKELDRLQSFRMREYVRIGTPDQVEEFRNQWMARAELFAEELQLPHRIDLASDPFFGRTGQLLAMNQVERALKFELLIPLRSDEDPTACMSFNYHRDHFGKTWQLHDAKGEASHSGCVAFGIDRLAVALFATHGTEIANWPLQVRGALAL